MLIVRRYLNVYRFQKTKSKVARLDVRQRVLLAWPTGDSYRQSALLELQAEWKGVRRQIEIGRAETVRLLAEQSIRPAPGSGLIRVLRFAFTKRAYETVFGQALRDMREEHAEALAANSIWLAKWRAVQTNLVLLRCALQYLLVSIVQLIASIWTMGR